MPLLKCHVNITWKSVEDRNYINLCETVFVVELWIERARGVDVLQISFTLMLPGTVVISISPLQRRDVQLMKARESIVVSVSARTPVTLLSNMCPSCLKFVPGLALEFLTFPQIVK